MAQFVLTITSDSAEEIASFLSPSRTTVSAAEPSSEPQPKSETQSEEPKRKGRPPKASEPSPEPTPDPIPSSDPEPSATSESDVTLADVKALINQAVKVKPAKAVVDALTATCGTAAPGAMDAGQLAKAKTVLEGLLNG